MLKLSSLELFDGEDFNLQSIYLGNPKREVPADLSEHSYRELDLDGCIAIKGMVNSHDHLGFNLFPQITKRKFQNYVEWKESVHSGAHQKIINSISSIPFHLRVEWGLLKNLICGFTTVVHHGPTKVASDQDMVALLQTEHLHSLEFEKFWRSKLLFHYNDLIVAHVGEGVDQLASSEAASLMRWNLWNKKIIGVHAISVRKEIASKFQAIVWCPASNLYLYDQTARMDKLKSEVKILFGSDSTLTSSWNIWAHLRLAKSIGHLTDKELLQTITTTPRQTFSNLKAHSNVPNYNGDLVIIRSKSKGNSWSKFFNANPNEIILIIRNGKIVYADESIDILNLPRSILQNQYWQIKVMGRIKYINHNTPKLLNHLLEYNIALNMPIESVSEQPLITK